MILQERREIRSQETTDKHLTIAKDTSSSFKKNTKTKEISYNNGK